MSEPLPAHWTLALVDVAVVHDVPLPQCLSDAEDGKLERDMRAQIPNEAAVRQSRDYVVDYFANVVAQVLTFPARVLVKFWKCLWSIFSGRPGCEPQGGGGSDGKGHGRGAAPGNDGGTVGHVPPGGTPGAVSGDDGGTVGHVPPGGTPGAVSDDDDTNGPDRDRGEGGADGKRAGPAGGEGNEEEEEGTAASLHQHGNIVPGLDVAVRVNRHLLTFTDLNTREKWLTQWPPNPDGKVARPLPEFSEAIRIVSASVAERQLVVEIESIQCAGGIPAELYLKADPEPGSKVG